MKKSRKVIITCAVTGAIHTPSMSPYLPISGQEIADAAIGAAEAGAAIVHLHARKPEDGSPSQDPELFKAFLPHIKAASDVVINITTGGAPTMLVAERLVPVHTFKPEVASLNMGSMNFADLGTNLWLLGLGPATTLPLLLFAIAARRIPLTTLGLMQYLSPTVQFVLGLWLFHEPFTFGRLAGFGLIWFALAVYTADSWRTMRRLSPT